MKRAVGLGCLLAVLLAPVALADLAGDIDAVLKDKLLAKAKVGIEIVRLAPTASASKPIYQRDSQSLLTPASNLKLTTTSAALDRFGPDFKFQTTLLLHNEDLVLIGDGDPSFGDAEYLRRVGWNITTVYENWVSQLKKLNVTHVARVIVDDSIFDEQMMHPNWPMNQIDHWYEAEVAGMNLNANCVIFQIQAGPPGTKVQVRLVPPTDLLQVDNSCVSGKNDVVLGRKPGTNQIVLSGQAPQGVVSSLQETVHDPAMFAANVLSDTGRAAGISVGSVQRDRTMRKQRQQGPGSAWKVIGVHQTPLAVALARANKDSINLYAECLCKRLGYESTKSSGSWENGTAAVAAFLRQAGVATSEFHLDDGSGLSKHNAITPHALVQVLVYDFYGKNHDALLNSLSIAGVDGTLEERFRGSDLRRRVIGKSGFVEGVSCLSGFLKARDNQWYAFSIMMNDLPYKSNSLAKTLQERIVRAVDASAAAASARG